MANFEEKIADLRVAQGKTNTLLRSLADKLDPHVEKDDERHRELMEFRVKSSAHLAEVATILAEVKKRVDTITETDIPTLQQARAGTEATLKIHTWIIRAIVGVTLLAVLGGTVTSLATCDVSSASASSSAEGVVEIEEIIILDAGLDGEI